MKRSDSYDEKLSQKLKNPAFAQEFLLALVDADDEDAIEIEDALRLAISKMGTTDFPKLVRDDLTGEQVAQLFNAFISSQMNFSEGSREPVLNPSVPPGGQDRVNRG